MHSLSTLPALNKLNVCVFQNVEKGLTEKYQPSFLNHILCEPKRVVLLKQPTP